MLARRGDEITTEMEWLNYVVFCHRARGSKMFLEEFEANVCPVLETLQGAASNFAPPFVNGDGCGLPYLADRAVVIVSSICAEDPTIGESFGYNVSKAALNQIGRLFSKRGGIRVNTVSPAGFTAPGAKINAHDVARVIAFLCSPQSSGINGQDIKVTG